MNKPDQYYNNLALIISAVCVVVCLMAFGFLGMGALVASIDQPRTLGPIAEQCVHSNKWHQAGEYGVCPNGKMLRVYQ